MISPLNRRAGGGPFQEFYVGKRILVSDGAESCLGDWRHIGARIDSTPFEPLVRGEELGKAARNGSDATREFRRMDGDCNCMPRTVRRGRLLG